MVEKILEVFGFKTVADFVKKHEALQARAYRKTTSRKRHLIDLSSDGDNQGIGEEIFFLLFVAFSRVFVYHPRSLPPQLLMTSLPFLATCNDVDV